MAIGDTTAILIGYLGKATRWGREIWAPGESNGAIPVNIQDQHTQALDLRFIKQLALTTLSATAAVGAKTIVVTSTTGFVDGVTVAVFTSEGDFYIGQQVGAVAGNTVTLDTPICIKFPAGSNALAANHHLNVNGSSTTQIFQIGPVGLGTGVTVDITRIMGYIQTDSTMDDSLFGNLAALTNGVVLRINGETIKNVWNVKTNGEIGLICFDAALSNRAPSGSFGFRFRNTYAGQGKHGVTLRLEPGDKLEILIQDNLTALEDFQMMAQGHIVTD